MDFYGFLWWIHIFKRNGTTTWPIISVCWFLGHLGSPSHIGGKFTSQWQGQTTRHHQSTPRKQLGIGSSDGSEADLKSATNWLKSYPRCEPWWPWCWNIYLHDWVVFGVNVGKYSSTMEHIRYWGAVYWTKAMTRNLRCQLHRRNYHHNGICCCWEALSHRIHVCHIW